MSRFVVQITFHRAQNLPIADLTTFSSDPYIHATLLLPNPSPEQPPPLTFRTPTVRRSRNPEWTLEQERDDDDLNSKLPTRCQWIIGGVEASGFTLVLRLRDEDPGNHDDKLGRAYVHIAEITENMELCEQSYDVKKRRAKPIVYIQTYLAALSPRKSKRISKHASVLVSVKVLHKDEGSVNKVYTLGPNRWSQHFSPLIGALTPALHSQPQPQRKDKQKATAVTPNGDATGTPDPNTLHPTLSSTSSLSSEVVTSAFVGNKLQLTGPVPNELRHEFVGYATFVQKMFTYTGIRGRLLNKAMHHQYRSIYSYDKATIYGIVLEDESVTSQFLKLTNFGRGGRLFTYVITLDGEWRFTETGPEFAVDLLSKHTMHADVAKVIAFSGEFFVRKCVHKPGGGFASGQRVENKTIGKDTEDETEDESGPSSKPIEPEPPTPSVGVDEDDSGEPKHHKPKHYELVIDNDSGTYRPKKELLPVLREWLDDPARLGGLGRITAVDGFDEGLKKAKENLGKIKKQKQGNGAGGMLRRGSSASDVGAKPFSTIGLAQMIPPETKAGR